MTETKKRRAARVVLGPGEHSIDRVTPVAIDGGFRLQWRIMLHDGRAKYVTTQAPTRAEVRARARAKAAELLQTSGASSWSLRSPVAEYMEAVTKPAIESERLAEATRARYWLSYRLLLGECSSKEKAHRHRHALKGLSIEAAMRPRALKECLEEIGKLHGQKNVKHAKLVASKYLARPLKLDGLLQYNPLADLDLDLSAARKPPVQRGGHALTREQYRQAINWLLTQDPTQVEKPRRGRWTLQDRIAERRALLEFVLTQAATGMRTSEIGKRPVSEVEVDDKGNVVFVLGEAATKTRKTRRVPVLDDTVARLLRERIEELPDGAYLFGAPTDPMKEWLPRNRDRKLAALYEELAEACDIEMFKVERGHSWRTTINSILADTVPEDQRIRLLGHTREINRSHYTDAREVEALKAAASQALTSC
ncbi:MAG: tyrosine-type recombinase/integrase [Trueperella sp.]|uniref:tyrosine-type recombinase/integrase n=1 Tax=Trueperella sp. TaxID=2699835 RepID=UPI0025DD8379|nr:tyrosine-type recombinase/integrase [Trueperella sp.]MCI7306452.1 tyrosine-type recombinase/integrase [Trueperella sp.]